MSGFVGQMQEDYESGNLIWEESRSRDWVSSCYVELKEEKGGKSHWVRTEYYPDIALQKELIECTLSIACLGSFLWGWTNVTPIKIFAYFAKQ